eukprot:scaffold100011_cov30-Tisochrysis_lutea.AAC.4
MRRLLVRKCARCIFIRVIWTTLAGGALALRLAALALALACSLVRAFILLALGRLALLHNRARALCGAF